MMLNFNRRYCRTAPTLVLAGAACWVACSAPQPEPSAAESPAPPKILQFYADAATIGRGGQALLCYGVENVSAVRLEPTGETLAVSPNRCIAVTPTTTTEYRLVAEGGGVTVRSNPLEIKVSGVAAARRPAPAESPRLIEFFSSSATEVRPGEMVTFCYGAKGARSLSLDPPVQRVEPADRFCFQTAVQTARRFTLTATGPGGTTDAVAIDIRVAP
jgi:hypothetical protein